jgi:hypothetical protein
MSTLSTGPTAQRPVPQEKGLIPEPLKIVLLVILLLAVVYQFYDDAQYRKATKTELARISDQLLGLESKNKTGEANLSSQISSLKGEIVGTQEAVGTTKLELKKTTAQIQAEGQQTKNELSQAIASKADTSQVDAQVKAAKSDAENRIGQVSTEVGGVKTQVVAVKTDLETTRRDLEGTQRQLVDVRDTLSAAVAKNATELSQLRLKGERDYIEFTLPKKKEMTKVEDIRLVLTGTDPKKGMASLKIIVDDNQLDKRDKIINEPIIFLVGQHRVRYEVVINWVQKDKAGGYLSVPKDKTLSAERSAK